MHSAFFGTDKSVPYVQIYNPVEEQLCFILEKPVKKEEKAGNLGEIGLP